jgi:hypothetical protein
MNIKTRREKLEQQIPPISELDETDPAALFALLFSEPDTKEEQRGELDRLRAKAFTLFVEMARKGDFLEACKRRDIDITPPVVRDEDVAEGEI